MTRTGGSDADYEAVFRASFPPVVRVAYLIVGDWEVAREVAQDAFVQLLVHWPKVSTYENRGAWIRRVAIRRAVRVRSRSAAPAAGFAREASDGAVETAIDLRRAILSLPRRQRAAVVLYYLCDLPVVEVAEALGCAEGTAKTYLHRARQQLGLLLKEEVDDATR